MVWDLTNFGLVYRIAPGIKYQHQYFGFLKKPLNTKKTNID